MQDLKELKLKNKQTPAEKEKKTIAVLPFENISPDKDADYFAEGLAEELIAGLAKIKEIKLVAPANTMKYKGTDKDIKTLGRELAAGFIMQGTVRKFKDDLRISVKLMDVAQESQLWGETYKGKLEDVFDIQEKVSKEIVDALRVNLSLTEKVVLSKRATLNAEAFDHYLHARNFLYRLTKNNVNLAIQLFEKAIELDPRYAAAHAGLGEAYATLYQYFESNESYLDKAIETSLKALMYDPTLSEAYTALGLAYFDKKLLEEAITATLKAIELDPENYVAYWILGRIYHTTDRGEEAIQQFKKTISLNKDFINAYNDLIMAYEGKNDKENAKKALDETLIVFQNYLRKNPDDARAHIYNAVHLAAVNRKEEAIIEGQRALELNPGDSLMMYNAACLYSRLDDKKLAIKTLKDAIAAGQEDFEWFKRDPDLDNIKNEPEFMELMKNK